MQKRLRLYLDIWRGAFYSVILGLIYDRANFSTKPLPLNLFIILGMISIYLINDATTRFNSRVIIRINNVRDSRREVSIIWEVLWLVLEMIGLLFFVVWGISIVADSNPNYQDKLSEYSILIGIFCIVNFIHNATFIQAEEGTNFLRFILISLFRDASENYKKRKRWAHYLIEKKQKALIKLKEANEQCRKAKEEIKNNFIDRIKNGLRIRDILWLFSVVPHELMRKAKFCMISFDLGLTHILVQLSAFHVMVFNLLAGIVIILMPSNNNYSLLWEQWPYSFLLLLFSFLFYSITSYFEINHREGRPRAKFLESLTQCIGNLLLVFFYVFWLLHLSKSWLTIAVLLQGGIFAFVLLILSQPPKVRRA